MRMNRREAVEHGRFIEPVPQRRLFRREMVRKIRKDVLRRRARDVRQDDVRAIREVEHRRVAARLGLLRKILRNLDSRDGRLLAQPVAHLLFARDIALDVIAVARLEILHKAAARRRVLLIENDGRHGGHDVRDVEHAEHDEVCQRRAEQEHGPSQVVLDFNELFFEKREKPRHAATSPASIFRRLRLRRKSKMTVAST